MTRKLIMLSAIFVVVIVISVLLHSFYGNKAHAVLPTTGTWDIEEVDSAMGIAGFSISLDSNKAISHYELYIEDVLIGDRTPISQSLKTLALLLNEHELLHVKLFTDGEDQQTVATARLYPSGQLGIFWPGDSDPVATVIYSIEAENGLLRCVFNREPETTVTSDDFTHKAKSKEKKLSLSFDSFTWNKDQLLTEWSFKPLPSIEELQIIEIEIVFRKMVTAAVFTILSSSSEDNAGRPEGGDPLQPRQGDKDKDHPKGNEPSVPRGSDTEPSDPEKWDANPSDSWERDAEPSEPGFTSGDIVGTWRAEPTFTGSFIIDFSILLEKCEHITHYELIVSEHQIDSRIPIEGKLRTAGILLSVPEDVYLKLYVSVEAAKPSLIVNCTSQGKLVVQR